MTFKLPLARPCSSVLAPKAVQLLSRAQAAAAGVPVRLMREGKAGSGGALTAPGRLVLKGVPPEGVYGREAGDEMRAIGMIGGGDGLGDSRRRARGAAAWWANGPRLGDRVSNLAYRARPLGERGIVTALHAESRYVEVLFDGQAIDAVEEQGGMPDIPGATVPGGIGPKPMLVPWHSLLPLTAARTADLNIETEAVLPVSRTGRGGEAATRAVGPGGFAAAVQSGATLATAHGGPKQLASGGAHGTGRGGDRGEGLAPEVLQVAAVVAVGSIASPEADELQRLREM